jgi:hypothetical protein
LRSTPASREASEAFSAFLPCPYYSVSPLTDAREFYFVCPWRFHLTSVGGVTHNRSMKRKAPITTPIVTGAMNRTAEAARVLQLQYPAFSCETQQEISHELPGLPERVQAQGI